MLSLINNLCVEHFAELIDVCFPLADTFSLTKNGWGFDCERSERERVLSLFAPYHIRTLRTLHWFCQCVPPGYEKEVYLFRATEESKQILLSEYKSIFYEENVWTKPEDLCFFKDSRLILGSLAHERICYAYDYEEQFIQKITFQDAWENCRDVFEEQIRIPAVISDGL